MFRAGIRALITLTLSAALPQAEAQRACAAKVENFAGEKPILSLPSKDRDAIIKVVLPDLRAEANASGYDPEDLRPTKLAHSLDYWQVPGGRGKEHLWIVRFETPQACGAHDSCPNYVLHSSSNGFRNVVRSSDSAVGTNVGGASGVGTAPDANPAYPELLFLSHLSAYEMAVACFRWTGGVYRSTPCSEECAHFLDTPRPQ